MGAVVALIASSQLDLPLPMPVNSKVDTSRHADVLDRCLFDQVCKLLVLGQWCSQCTSVSSTNNIDCHMAAECGIKYPKDNTNLNIRQKHH